MIQFFIKRCSNSDKLPSNERKAIKKELEGLRLFPLKFEPKFTPKKGKKQSLIKKICQQFEVISYTRMGWFLLLSFSEIINVGKKIKKKLK